MQAFEIVPLLMFSHGTTTGCSGQFHNVLELTGHSLAWYLLQLSQYSPCCAQCRLCVCTTFCNTFMPMLHIAFCPPGVTWCHSHAKMYQALLLLFNYSGGRPWERGYPMWVQVYRLGNCLEVSREGCTCVQIFELFIEPLLWVLWTSIITESTIHAYT